MSSSCLHTARCCLLLLSLALALSFSPLSTFGQTYAGVPFKGDLDSKCVYFQSRTCTNVFWPVPADKLNRTTYDDELAADIRATTLWTGSRTCRRWYADFACRTWFPYCNNGAAWNPCLRECLAIQKRCPTFVDLDCKIFSNSGCMERQQLSAKTGLELPLTPGMKAFNTNQANPITVASMVTIALSLLLAVFLNANRLW